jgi:hypothetical protein
VSEIERSAAADEALDHLADIRGAVDPIGRAVTSLIDELRGLRVSLPVLYKTAKDAEKEIRLRKQLGDRPGPDYDDDPPMALGSLRVYFSVHNDYLPLRVAADGLRQAGRDLSSSMLLMMSAHFDSFVGNMIRAIFELRPEKREVLQRGISFADLDGVSSLGAARALLVEKEIETILRRRRTEQLEWFVSQCGMNPLDDSLISEFADVSALRNVIAHHGGRITNKVAVGIHGRESSLLSRYPVGSQVYITEDDLSAIHDTLFLVSIAISQGIWHEIRPDQSEEADAVFHLVTYTLLALDEFKLAQRTLLIGTRFQEKMGEEYRLRNLINLAQAYKWGGDPRKCEKTLDSEDWSQHDESFRLAAAALKDDWAGAARMMKACIQKNLMDRTSFKSWPLFREFRQTQEYREVYDEAFSV